MSHGEQWDPEPGGYEPQAGARRPASGAVTGVGIVGVIAGGMHVLFCGYLMVAGGAVLGMGSSAIEEAKKQAIAQGQDPAFVNAAFKEGGGLLGAIAGALIIIALIGIAIGVLTLIGAIGVLQRKGWGKTMTIVMASISIVLALGWLLTLSVLGFLFFAVLLTYIIMSFVILLSAKNAAEFR